MSQAAVADFFDNPFPHEYMNNLTRREKKQLRRKQRNSKSKQQSELVQLENIYPLTIGQQKTFKAYNEGKNLILHGVAGTGKTFISLYLALEAVLEGREPKPVTIIRSVVPTRDMGFLPGKIEEKSAIYEAPYEAICNELVSNKQDPYKHLKNRGYIEFSTTSFLRGLTFKNNTIIVDECQNMTFHELDSVITRMGEGSRVIFCGDFRQSDLWKEDERSGLNSFMSVVSRMKSFEKIEFTEDDIVRSDLVKEYILAKLEEGIV
jgi:phosphate starvation-inducible protein PhoH